MKGGDKAASPAQRLRRDEFGQKPREREEDTNSSDQSALCGRFRRWGGWEHLPHAHSRGQPDATSNSPHKGTRLRTLAGGGASGGRGIGCALAKRPAREGTVLIRAHRPREAAETRRAG